MSSIDINASTSTPPHRHHHKTAWQLNLPLLPHSKPSPTKSSQQSSLWYFVGNAALKCRRRNPAYSKQPGLCVGCFKSRHRGRWDPPRRSPPWVRPGRRESMGATQGEMDLRSHLFFSRMGSSTRTCALGLGLTAVKRREAGLFLCRPWRHLR